MLESGKNRKCRGRVRLENVEPQRVKHEVLPLCRETNTRTENVLTATNICPRGDLENQDDVAPAEPEGLRHPLVTRIVAPSSSVQRDPTAWPLPAVKQPLSAAHGAGRMLCEECIKADKSSPEVCPGHGFQTVTG